jgi:hypothetical protein
VTPERIRPSRAKGWRKPEGAVVVARPSKWGNPWRVGDALGTDLDSPYAGAAAPLDAALAVALYRAALTADREAFPSVLVGLGVTIDDVRAELAGHDLACWCPLDQPCHADVLLEVANGDTP